MWDTLDLTVTITLSPTANVSVVISVPRPAMTTTLVALVAPMEDPPLGFRRESHMAMEIRKVNAV